jgi:hypothetical protein
MNNVELLCAALVGAAVLLVFLSYKRSAKKYRTLAEASKAKPAYRGDYVVIPRDVVKCSTPFPMEGYRERPAPVKNFTTYPGSMRRDPPSVQRSYAADTPVAPSHDPMSGLLTGMLIGNAMGSHNHPAPEPAKVESYCAPSRDDSPSYSYSSSDTSSSYSSSDSYSSSSDSGSSSSGGCD